MWPPMQQFRYSEIIPVCGDCQIGATASIRNVIEWSRAGTGCFRGGPQEAATGRKR
jgi:hypothetical protein